jgi:hypothetical protein
MRYQISYHVAIVNPSEQLTASEGNVNSGIFDFPNQINSGESIYINFTKYINGNQIADPSEDFCISLNVKSVSHRIDRIGKFTELYISEEASNQGTLEGKLNNAREVFARLKF